MSFIGRSITLVQTEIFSTTTGGLPGPYTDFHRMSPNNSDLSCSATHQINLSMCPVLLHMTVK